jgi:hypothetical protein
VSGQKLTMTWIILLMWAGLPPYLDRGQVDIGRPGSIGCIRMLNTDLLELFDLTDVGTEVNIKLN